MTTTPHAQEPTSGALLPDTGAGAGHMLPLERPDEGAAVIARWSARVTASVDGTLAEGSG